MSKKTGNLLSAALVLGTLLSASGAIKATGIAGNAAESYNVIPGYDKDGQIVAVPNPDRH